MSDTFREVTREGWGSRLKGALGGVVIGLALFIASFVLLWWNEDRAVQRAEGINQTEQATRPADPARVTSALDGSPVHLTGMADTDALLRDPLFGLERNAIKLIRTVEMYQWEEIEESETRETLGGGTETVTTYEYRRGWHEGLIDSTRFRRPGGHENPSTLPYASQQWTAREVRLGAYRLGETLVRKMNRETDIAATPQLMAELAPEARARFTAGFGDWLHEAGYGGSPQIGDIRVRFEIVEPAEVSLIGLQQPGGRITTYTSANGEDIALLEYGAVPAETLFAHERQRNELLTWGLRLGGFLAMWLGLTMMFGVLRILAAFVPLFGRLIGAGIGLITGITAFSLSAITIALAWVAVRPVIGIPLLVLGAAGIVFIALRQRRAPQIA